jgi:hypothetical protein
MNIKDAFVNSKLNRILDDYRLEISKLADRLEFFSAEDLKNHLENKNDEIDFIKFCDSHIKRLKKDRRDGTAANHTSASKPIALNLKAMRYSP